MVTPQPENTELATQPGPNTPARRLSAAEKRKKVLELRLAGATYRQIGEQLGINPKTAHDHFKNALKDIPKEPAEQVREMELARLDEIQMRLTGRLRQNDLSVVNGLLRVMDARAKLTGIYQLPAGATDSTDIVGAFAGMLASAQEFAASYSPAADPEGL